MTQNSGTQDNDRTATLRLEDKARILSEALPFMQRYDRQVVVVKYGGHAMGNAETGAEFCPRYRHAQAERR